MLSYSDVLRWLPSQYAALSPVEIEDWLANRELFGEIAKPTEQDRALEEAYEMQTLLNNLGDGGVLEKNKYLIISGHGKTLKPGQKVFEVILEVGNKRRNLNILIATMVVVDTNYSENIKIKVKGFQDWKVGDKPQVVWSGSSIEKIIIKA